MDSATGPTQISIQILSIVLPRDDGLPTFAGGQDSRPPPGNILTDFANINGGTKFLGENSYEKVPKKKFLGDSSS
jgi:hypothetical protein